MESAMQFELKKKHGGGYVYNKSEYSEQLAADFLRGMMTINSLGTVLQSLRSFSMILQSGGFGNLYACYCVWSMIF